MRRIRLRHGLTGALVFGIIVLVAFGSGATSIILQNEITRSFERKMSVICSSMAAMLDAGKLQRIWQGREILALAEFKGALYGIGRDGTLCRIKTDAFGTAAPILKLPAPPSERPQLISTGNGLMYSVGGSDVRRWQIDPDTNEVAALPNTKRPEALLMSGSQAEAREIVPRTDHPLRNALGVVQLGEEVLALMPPGSASQQILAFKNVDEPESRVFLDGANLHLRSIATVDGQLYGAGDKLLKLGPEGVVPDFAAVANFADTNGPEYREYRQAIMRIHARCDVTYLYAFRLDGADIVYIVDAVTDPSWTPVGYRETLSPANGKGISLARAEGRAFVSPSLDYGLWGELKVSSAAVDKPGDQFPTMAGCDINVATIRDQTRHGIFLMLGAGVVTLLASLIVTFKIARRITQPILELNRQTLLWASGEANLPIATPDTDDREQLADSFEAARQANVVEERALLLQKIRAHYLDRGLSEQDCQWLAGYVLAQPGELAAGCRTTTEPAR